MKKTPFETLGILASALYGPNWMSPLSLATGIPTSTFWRWKSGTSPLRLDNLVFALLPNLLRRHARKSVRMASVAQTIVAAHPTRHGRAGVGKVTLKAASPASPSPAGPAPQSGPS